LREEVEKAAKRRA